MYPVSKTDMTIGNCKTRQKDEEMTHRIWWHEHQASRSKRRCESQGSRVSLWRRSHRRSRLGALASSFCLLYDACLIEFLSGKTSGLSPTSATNIRNDDNHWCLLWANPPLSVLPVYFLWSSQQLWGGLYHSSEEETEDQESDLSKGTQLVRGRDLFLMGLHFSLVQNHDVLVITCFQRPDWNAEL